MRYISRIVAYMDRAPIIPAVQVNPSISLWLGSQETSGQSVRFAQDLMFLATPLCCRRGITLGGLVLGTWFGSLCWQRNDKLSRSDEFRAIAV